MKKTNDKFLTISLMCIFLLVMMISFGATTVKGTFSASEVSCYTCSDSSIGSYVWGDYSDNNSCTKMSSYTTKNSCLNNNCSNSEVLDDDGNCVNNEGLVTVLFKSGSLTVYRSTCTLVNGSCRIALRQYQNNVGWSQEADCSNVVENSEEYITFSKAKTFTYYSCNQNKNGNSSSSNKKPSSSKDTNAIINNDNNNNGNPQTGSTWIIVVFLGTFLMFGYIGYVYNSSSKIKETR